MASSSSAATSSSATSKVTSKPTPSSSIAGLGLPDDESRFTIELEFVQCLANPDYLHWLALNKYLDDPAFIEFLKYLQYWRTPPYARYILYPHCLAILELLEQEDFRREMARLPFKEFLQDQQLLHWRFYFNNRKKHSTTIGGTWSNELNMPSAPSTTEGGTAGRPPASKT